MKNIKLLLLLATLLGIGFVSCDDEYAQPPVNLPEGGIGTGAWNNPMTAYQASLGSVNSDIATPWVKGYIVGFINTNIGNVLNENTADFTVPATVATNLLIASNPDERDWSKCVSVQLPYGEVRSALNLQNHPENQGVEVTIKGTTGSKYCGVYGVRDVVAYNFGSEGFDDGSDKPAEPEPVQPGAEGKTFYTALQATAAEIDWTFDNVEMPSPLSYVWSWKEYNGNHYLNASAYYSSQNIPAKAYAKSPAVSFAGYKNVYAEFEHAAKFQTTIQELGRFAVREVGSADWTEYVIPTWPNAGTWTFSNSGQIDLSAFAGKNVEVAFLYVSTADGADTWEIRNLTLKGVE